MIGLTQVTPPATEPLIASDLPQFMRLDDDNREPAPGAITGVAIAGAGAGNVDNGAHRYLATFVTADGETGAGTISAAVTVTDKTTNGKVALSGIPIGGSMVTARKLYRTAAGGSTYMLLATIADNTTATYSDNSTDASLGAGAPATNTTLNPLLNIFIASARAMAEQTLRRALVTQTWDLTLDAFPVREQQIPLPTLQSVVSISYVDANGNTQTLDPSTYVVDSKCRPGRVFPAYGSSWPSVRNQLGAITIRFVCGYGAASAVPACVKHWMMLRINTLWENRFSVVIEQRISQAVQLEQPYVDGIMESEMVYGYIIDPREALRTAANSRWLLDSPLAQYLPSPSLYWQ